MSDDLSRVIRRVLVERPSVDTALTWPIAEVRALQAAITGGYVVATLGDTTADDKLIPTDAGLSYLAMTEVSNGG